MLERTSACLDSGVRCSLRARRQVARSRRLLHSTFWNHGANAIDLPPYVLHTPPQRVADRAREATPVSKHNPAESQTTSYPDGLFLDFLYPPQTLAYITRVSCTTERRDRRQISNGSLYRSRGYSSLSPAGDGKNQQQDQEAAQSMGDNALSRLRRIASKERDAFDASSDQEKESNVIEKRGHGIGGTEEIVKIEDYTAEEALRELRRVILPSWNQKENTAATRVWAIYNSMDQKNRSDLYLRQKMVIWFSKQNDQFAAERALQLFMQLNENQRGSLEYESAVVACLVLKDISQAMKINFEAMIVHEDQTCGADSLMRHAVEQRDWQLAVKILRHYSERRGSMDRKTRKESGLHAKIYRKTTQASNLQSAIDDLVGKLINSRKNPLHASLREILRGLCGSYIRIIGHMDGPLIFGALSFLHRTFTTLQAQESANPTLYEAVLLILSDAKIPGHEARKFGLISYVYRMYSQLPDFKPSVPLLAGLLVAWSRYYSVATALSGSRHAGLRATTIVRDWKAHHGELDDRSLFLLMETYARRGEQKAVDTYASEYRSLHATGDIEAGRLWPLIYVHAVNRNATAAAHQFQRIRKDYGVEPDRRCWNVLLYAYERADDRFGASDTLQRMIETGMQPDEFSFTPLLTMYGKAGDADGVADALATAERYRIQPTTIMLNSLIVANVNSDNMEGAENALDKALEMVKEGRAKGPLTPCFNTLMTAHALRRDDELTMRVYRHMKDENIKLDSNTLAALITVLALTYRTERAHQILRQIMPKENHRPTAFHYAAIMVGYVHESRFQEALDVHKEMLAARIKDTVSTRLAYLQAKASLERDSQRSKEDATPLEDTIKELVRMLDTPGPSFSAGPEFGIRHRNPETAVAAHFQFLISLHGRMRCFDAAKKLFEKYMSAVGSGSDKETSLPIGLISAMMSLHTRLGQHDEVERYWHLAQREADRVRKVPAPINTVVQQMSDSRTGVSVEMEPPTVKAPQTDTLQSDLIKAEPPLSKPAASMRYLLSRPLRYYLSSLSKLSPPAISTMTSTVASLLNSSYGLDSYTWNYYIRLLCDCSPPRALLAFSLTERFLMPNWPGWTHPRRTLDNRVVRPPASARDEGLQYIKARYLAPGELMPQYRTMVYLASALLDVRRSDTTGLGRRVGSARKRMSRQQIEEEAQTGTVAEIKIRAPKTLEAVYDMPAVYDTIQRRLIRGNEYRPD